MVAQKEVGIGQPYADGGRQPFQPFRDGQWRTQGNNANCRALFSLSEQCLELSLSFLGGEGRIVLK